MRGKKKSNQRENANKKKYATEDEPTNPPPQPGEIVHRKRGPGGKRCLGGRNEKAAKKSNTVVLIPCEVISPDIQAQRSKKYRERRIQKKKQTPGTISCNAMSEKTPLV